MKRPRAAVPAASALVTTLALTGALAGPVAAANATSGQSSSEQSSSEHGSSEQNSAAQGTAPQKTAAQSAVAQAGKGASATSDDPVTHEENDRVPKGAEWTQHYFPSSDGSGTELHADVLLPEGMKKGKKVPVILSVGPYFSHSGQSGPEGWTHTGPSNRFQDFIEGTDLFQQGYALVMVDLRGFGGSTGCLDWGGPGEQADVRAAVDWAAGRQWSTGAVGMYGKSYDGVTGLIGNNEDQKALKAVVSQEPLWDMYPYIYSNGVPRPNVTGTANAYNSIATMDPLADDDPRYQANARYEDDNPRCLTENSAGYRIPDRSDPHWTARDLAKSAKGTDTPLFVTQGFIEPNTKPEEMQEYLGNHKGVERGWVGQWDHVRGGDRTPDGRLAMGREGWYDETLSFYDRYLKGKKPDTRYPSYAVEDSTGAWRAQQTWPAEEGSVKLPLGSGSYVDDGGASARKAAGLSATPAPAKPDGSSREGDMEKAPASGQGTPKGLAQETVKKQQAGEVTSSYFTWSEPLKKDVRITGTPRVDLKAEGKGNVMVKLYDVGPDGKAVMFDEQVSLLRSGRLSIDLKSTDWTLKAGHMLAVETGSVQTGSWRDTPSGETIRVKNARLSLSLDDPADDAATGGDRSPYLDTYLRQNTVTLPAGRPGFTVPRP